MRRQHVDSTTIGLLNYCYVNQLPWLFRCAKESTCDLATIVRASEEVLHAYLENPVKENFLALIQKSTSTHKIDSSAREFVHNYALINLVLMQVEGGCARNPPKAAVDCIAELCNLNASQIEESVPKIEDLLKTDPAGVYPRMNDRTKRHYRNAVHEIASATSCSGDIVVERALGLAAKHPHDNTLRRHVGFYLIDGGRNELLAILGSKVNRNCRASSRILFATGANIAVSVCVIDILSWGTSISKFLAFFIVYEFCLRAYRWVVEVSITPRIVPALDFTTTGIPAQEKCVIIIPILLTSIETVRDCVQNAEKNLVLANDSQVNIILLVDLPDSLDERIDDSEQAILEFCHVQVDNLNKKHGRGVFGALVRKRVWCPQQKSWMGWERKRGKIEEFNSFARGGAHNFEHLLGNTSGLSEVKYAIVLDDDSIVCVNTVQNMVGAISHPLVRPHVDATSRRVSRGHGILVPYLGSSEKSAAKWSNFHIVGGGVLSPLVEPPEFRNTFFDQYGSALYPGKGIYDIDVYRKCSENRVPPDLILSHDTIESDWLRPGVCNAAALVESYPCDNKSKLERTHRWARGDLQNAYYSVFRENELSLFAKILIVDQLRTTLSYAFLFMFFLSLGSLRQMIEGVAVVFTLHVIVGLSSFLRNAVSKFEFQAGPLIDSIKWFWIRMSECVIQALVLFDALLTVIVRLLRKSNLLEWAPSSSLKEKSRSRNGRIPVYVRNEPYIALLLAALGLALDSWGVCVLALCALGRVIFFDGERDESFPQDGI